MVRRSLSALFTVALAMLLSLCMVAPAAHADAWSDYIKNPYDPKYKYSFNYYKQALRPAGGIQPGAQIPVSGTVNPSNTGGSYYLNQIKQSRGLNPANVPLEGKIITPGQTVVRAPVTYAPTSKFVVGVLPGVSRLLGTAGVGIGGTSVAPANANQLALNQGVSQGCIDNGASCTSAEQQKRFMIGSCAQFTGANSCDTIGALGSNGETKSADWFKDGVIPFLNDLWANITGQGSDKGPQDSHQDVVMSRGCYRSFGIEYRGENNITLHQGSEIVAGRPTDTFQGAYWDNECSAAQLASYSSGHATMKTTCVDPSGSSTYNGGASAYGYTNQLAYFSDNATGANKVGLCNTAAASGKPLTLVRVIVFQNDVQSYYNTAGSGKYSAIRYSEWTNPDPELNTIEDTKITTTWTCRTKDGTLYNFTKSVTKIAAAVAPACPEGSDLTKHDVMATGGATGTKTLDAGAEVPSEVSKYPLCLGSGAPGCTMDVYVDGTKCTVARTECRTWPAVSAQTPSRVVCKWGSYTLPTSNCNGIANGYQSETGVVFDPKAGTWIGIDTYGNPIAPNPEPWNPTNPNPAPGVNPANPPAPTPGTGTGTPGFPTTGTSPSTNCDAPSWSWNPVEWVHNPVVCALEDAFVPKTDVTARLDALKTIALDKPPISWLYPPPMVGPGGGCPDWSISIPGLGSKNVVCDSSFTAAVTGARAPMFGLIAGAMVWPLMRSLWYAAIPILRVTPSSSK